MKFFSAVSQHIVSYWADRKLPKFEKRFYVLEVIQKCDFFSLL